VVLFGVSGQNDLAIGHEHVMVGRGDVNMARVDELFVHCMRDAKLTVFCEERWQDAALLADVQDNHDGGF
jgi:hypothetical protein